MAAPPGEETQGPVEKVKTIYNWWSGALAPYRQKQKAHE